MPRDEQPEVVQAAVREPAAASETFIVRTSAKLDAASAAVPDGDDASQRKVVVSETRCAVVTR